MRNYFPKHTSGAPLHTLCTLCAYIYDVSVGFVAPLSYKVVYSYICGHRRVTVARYRIICLVFNPVLSIEGNVPFLSECGSHETEYVDSTGSV